MKVFYPTVRIEIDGVRNPPPRISFTLDKDMLTESDMLTAVYPATGEFLRELRLDAPIRVYFDRRQVFTGRITDRPDQGGRVTITARDHVDRLLEESVPGVGFKLSGALSAAFSSLSSPWFDAVEFSNAGDRDITTGRGIRARVAGEPVVTRSALRALGQWVEAGESRWSGIERLLKLFRLLAWSSADGKTLIVTRPNYAQTTQYRFVRSAKGSNVESVSRGRSVAGRYSLVEYSGTQRAPDADPPDIERIPGVKRKKRVNYGSRGIVRDTSGDFQAEKRLLVNENSTYPGDAQAQAERIFGEQQARADTISIGALGFGQDRALFTYDRAASITLDESARISRNGRATVLRAAPYYVTSVSFSADASQQRSRMALVPIGTQLV